MIKLNISFSEIKLINLFELDTNILYANKNLRSLEAAVNSELKKLYLWLASNKLSLNTKKTNFVIFHPYQKSVDYFPRAQSLNLSLGALVLPDVNF